MLGLASLAIDMPLWLVLVIFFIFGFGMGNVIAPASTVMQNALPLARAGAGSAVQNTVRQVFGALGVAVIGTVLATQYASNVAPVLGQLPPGTPDDARELADELRRWHRRGARPARARTVPPPIWWPRASRWPTTPSSTPRTSRASSRWSLVLIAALVVWFLLPPITPPQRGGHGVPGGDTARGRRPTEHRALGRASTRAEADAEAAHVEAAYVAEAAASPTP